MELYERLSADHVFRRAFNVFLFSSVLLRAMRRRRKARERGLRHRLSDRRRRQRAVHPRLQNGRKRCDNSHGFGKSRGYLHFLDSFHEKMGDPSIQIRKAGLQSHFFNAENRYVVFLWIHRSVCGAFDRQQYPDAHRRRRRAGAVQRRTERVLFCACDLFRAGRYGTAPLRHIFR